PKRSRLIADVYPRWQSQCADLHARPRLAASAAEGWTDQHICAALDISRNTSIRVRQLYPGSADWRPCCTTNDNSAIVRP
ncbi:MAG TPA: hypothetical protein VIY29_14440, partial [Ktedonobacteraceae bacterium]